MLLNSQVSGSGNHVLIVLHGFLGMLDNWKSFAKRMDQNKYQIHLVDQRNHGKSFHNNLFNYEILATDLKNYIDHYKIKKFSLIGHSMGGKTAMMFSSMYPELIKKLIIVDILPIYYSNDYNKIIDSLKSLDLKKLVSRVNIDKALESEFKEPTFRAFLLKNLYRAHQIGWSWRGHVQCRGKVRSAHIDDRAPSSTQIGENLNWINTTMGDHKGTIRL